MVDCIVIGAGAAGVSAALTLKALKINFIWLGNKDLSVKIRSAEKIKNYPGLYGVSGGDLKDVFLSQINGEGIEITEDKVNGVYPTDGGYTVLGGKSSYEAKTVILATGVEALKPVKGEAEFLGRGVSYCAVCDGFLYRGKEIAVVIEGEEEFSEVQLLAQYARAIHLFCIKKLDLPAIENVMFEEGRLTEIKGDMRVKSVVCGGREISVDGVFVLKQAIAADNLVHGLKTVGGQVEVARNGATNLAGMFAAGDVTGRPYQYAKAAGEGNVCAYSVNAYLNSLKTAK